MRPAHISIIRSVYPTRTSLKRVAIVSLLFTITIYLSACDSAPGNPTSPAESKFLLISVVPSAGVNDVPVTGLIAATFSDDLDTGSLTDSSFVIAGITGTISYFGRTATFKPLSNLKHGTDYSVLLSSEIKSLSGRSLVDTTWSFRTEGDSVLPDPPPPPHE